MLVQLLLIRYVLTYIILTNSNYIVITILINILLAVVFLHSTKDLFTEARNRFE